MGTHPIFESDFDCLTEMSECEISEKRCSDGLLNCTVRCPMCPSVILSAKVATLHTEKVTLPRFAKDDQPEEITLWWKVDDMFKFENIGFSKSVSNIKYLTCADCEIGPLGYHDPSKPKEFLIALSRVKYDD